MAADEFVSVSSQADVEKAELARADEALHPFKPKLERAQLPDIYAGRGVEAALAWEVASQTTPFRRTRAMSSGCPRQ
jgi:VIT1/CCC1 family predicted Fe2+/Mn2+ transporter